MLGVVRLLDGILYGIQRKKSRYESRLALQQQLLMRIVYTIALKITKIAKWAYSAILKFISVKDYNSNE